MVQIDVAAGEQLPVRLDAAFGRARGATRVFHRQVGVRIPVPARAGVRLGLRCIIDELREIAREAVITDPDNVLHARK